MAVSLSVVSCHRFDEASPLTSAPTVSMDRSDEVVLTTELVSDSIMVSIKDKMIPVFQAVEGGFELLTKCEHSGTYKYETLVSSQGKRRQKLSGATLEVSISGAKAIDAGFDSQQLDEVEISKAGYHESLAKTPTFADFQDCPEATHVAKIIYVGAFSELESKQGSGGIRAGAGPLRGGGRHAQSQANFRRLGDSKECTVAKMREDPSKPPLGCDAPIAVKVVPIDKSLRYCFDGRSVLGSHSQEATMTTPELDELDELFHDMLHEQGSKIEVKVTREDDCSQADVRCSVIRNTTPKHVVLECSNADGKIYAQKHVEQAALKNTAWTVAQSLLPRPHEVHALEPGRVVILVDLSTSMVVNDEQTFIHDSVQESVRYGLVDATLGGLLTHGTTPQVSIMAFTNDITKWAKAGDADFSTLSLESQRAGLQWLKGVLEVSPYSDGTDIVGALNAARRALDSSPRPDAGYDAVILITDGFHRRNTGMSVQEAATELTDAGVELHVIRVQLNDIEKLRGLMKDKTTRKAILSRWTRFSKESGWEKRLEEDPTLTFWESEIATTSGENNNGTALLENLQSVKLTTLILNEDDQTRDPLITAHRFLLPNLGVRTTIDAPESDCEPPREQIFPNGEIRWQKSCRIKHIPIGNEFAVKVSLPKCMRKLVEATLEIPGSAVTLTPNQPLASMNGGIVEFVPVRMGRSTPGQSTGVKGHLIIMSDSGERCL